MSGRVAAHRALVVEDDGQLRAVVAEYLRGEGFVVDEAGDGGVALSAAREAPPDVLVLDMQMPAMDGAAVLASWNESPALKAVPVVVVSGAPDLPEIVERFDVRATLVKPVDLDVLRAVVEQVVAHPSSRPAASV
jgi:DNA-binding response OmpR family regulator